MKGSRKHQHHPEQGKGGCGWKQEEGETGMRGKGDSLPSGTNRLFHYVSCLRNYNLS